MARVAATSFVGRAAELAVLRRCVDDARSGGPAPLAVLLGEAGVGKTRCLQTFLATAAEAGVTVLLGGCPPLSGNELPYAPLAEALRGLRRTAGPERMAEWLAGQDDVLGRLVPELATTSPGADPASDAAPGRLFEAVLAMVDRMTEDGPVILAVEDVHWADRSSRDLLALLIRATADRPLITVLTCRNDELPPGHPVVAWLADLGRTRPTERIELARLDPGELDELLASVLGAPPEPKLAGRIYARSEGNPFFAEELLALVPAGDGLPATVADTVLCRVGALPLAALWLVRTAAVAAGSGSEVPHELLADVLGWPDDQLLPAVRAAVAAHVLRGTEHGYSFRHALTREAVESELLPVERARLHASVAAGLSGLGPVQAGPAQADPVTTARVAYHWHAAGDRPRALAAAVAAGTAATKVFAYHVAAQLFERAIELWPAVPDAARVAGVDEAGVYERAAEAIYVGQHQERAEELAREALRRIDSRAEPERAARLHLLAGSAMWAYRADSMAAVAEVREAAALLPEDSPVLADALAAEARFLMLMDQHADSLAAAERAIALADLHGKPFAKASALVSLGASWPDEDGDETGREAMLAGRELAERIGDAVTAGRSYVNLSSWYGARNRVAEAVAEARAGIAASLRFGIDRTIGMVLRSIVIERLVESGDWAEAEAIGRDLMDVTGNPRMWAMRELGHLEVARGDFAAADALLKELFALVDGPVEAQVVAPPYEIGAELALVRGEVDQARQLVRTGLDLLHRYGGEQRNEYLVWLGWRGEADAVTAGHVPDPEWVSRLRAEIHPVEVPAEEGPALLIAGEISRFEGASDPELWDTATDYWTGIGAHYMTGYPRYRAAEAYLARGDRATATERIRTVYDLASRLGAGPLLASVEDLARRARLNLTPAPAPATLPHGLTAREHEVLTLVAAGLTNREIAGKLFISEHTVGVHVSRILAKLGVARRTEAAAAAHRLGLA
jgi:DNA-binding CsgD family transcriptional regulator/tetratricopeptide (TPR) repeat protein